MLPICQSDTEQPWHPPGLPTLRGFATVGKPATGQIWVCWWGVTTSTKFSISHKRDHESHTLQPAHDPSTRLCRSLVYSPNKSCSKFHTVWQLLRGGLLLLLPLATLKSLYTIHSHVPDVAFPLISFSSSHLSIVLRMSINSPFSFLLE